jgi:hypothetical protein
LGLDLDTTTHGRNRGNKDKKNQKPAAELGGLEHNVDTKPFEISVTN